MSLFRYSLLGLAGVVTLIAVGCAVLVYASPWLSQSVWLIVFLLLAFALLAALLRSGPQRSWWIGCALFGWLYVLTLHGPFSSLGKSLVIDNLLDRVALEMPNAKITVEDPFGGAPRRTRGGGFGGGMPGAGGMSDPGMMPDAGMAAGITSAASATYQAQNTEYINAFIRTGQGIVALLLMILGGVVGRLVQQRNGSHAVL